MPRSATRHRPTPPRGQINTTDIAFQYDGVADFPEYPIDLLADANAIAGFDYIHGTYLEPDGAAPDGTPYGYTATPDGGTLLQAINSPVNRQTYGDTTYVTIPATTLPIVQPLLDSQRRPAPPHWWCLSST